MKVFRGYRIADQTAGQQTSGTGRKRHEARKTPVSEALRESMQRAAKHVVAADRSLTRLTKALAGAIAGLSAAKLTELIHPMTSMRG